MIKSRGGRKADKVWPTLLRLVQFLKPFTFRILIAGFFSISAAFLGVIGPRLIGSGVDTVWNFIQGGHSVSAAGKSLSKTMLLLLCVYLGSWTAGITSGLIMVYVGQKFLFNLRTKIFDKVLELALSFFDRHETGDVMSRQMNDSQTINRVLSHGVLRFAINLFTFVGIIISMMTLNWRLALVSFSILPVMFINSVYFSRRARKAFRKTRKTIGKISTELEENIAGVKVAQAFSRQQENIASFRGVNAENREANITAQSITAAFAPAMNVLSVVGLIVVVGYGGYLAVNDMVSIGIIVAFLQYVRRFFGPVRQVAQLWGGIQSALAGGERIFELLDDPQHLDDPEDGKELPRIDGRVEFRDVRFEYLENEPVLKGVSFEAEPGSTVALVGPTGAGKTTIINLIGRFYDVTGGSVLVDGEDVREVSRRSLRSQMSLVLQDTFLFSDSILDNIRYGRPDATDDEVKAAAELAKAHDFIEGLPEGYETKLTEGASNLSRGQQQLLAIARAILADPRILILDEATSSVDTRTERLIQDAMGQLLKGRTSFVVAHRLSTIQRADVLLVIQDGEIVERGSHEELMESRGVYHGIYMSQFSPEANNEPGSSDLEP